MMVRSVPRLAATGAVIVIRVLRAMFLCAYHRYGRCHPVGIVRLGSGAPCRRQRENRNQRNGAPQRYQTKDTRHCSVPSKRDEGVGYDRCRPRKSLAVSQCPHPTYRTSATFIFPIRAASAAAVPTCPPERGCCTAASYIAER